MRKAEKIELRKKGDPNYQIPYHVEFDNWLKLYINDELISESIIDPTKYEHFKCFQNLVCDFCGQEGCNPGGMLMVKKHSGSILILPAFSLMEEFKEFDSSNSEGDVECPPHKWFIDGVLKVEGAALNKLIELIPGLSLELVPEMTEQQLENMNKWELMVKEKPEGFINRAYLEE